MYVCMYVCIYIYIYIYTHTSETGRWLLIEEHIIRDIHSLCNLCWRYRGFAHELKLSEVGMIRWETLIELKFLNSSFSSSSSC